MNQKEYSNELGTFYIERFFYGVSLAIRMGTTAPLNSPFAKRWLTDLSKQLGMVEIDDISVGDGYIIIDMNDAVTNEQDAKEVIRKYMLSMMTAASELDRFDRTMFVEQQNHGRSQLRDMMATSSEDSLSFSTEGGYGYDR